MTSVARIPRRYFVEFSLAMSLYFVTVIGRYFLVRQIDDHFLETAVLLSPIIPIGLIGLAIFRFYRGVDEFLRLRFLKIAAITAGVTAAVVASWCFLSDVGAPPLSNFGVLLVMAGAFSLAGFLFRAEDAYSEKRIGGFVRVINWLSTFAFAGGSVWLAVANNLGQHFIVPLAVVACAATVSVSVSLHIGPSSGPL